VREEKMMGKYKKRKWGWATSIDTEGRIHFPKEARDYLALLEHHYKSQKEKWLFIVRDTDKRQRIKRIIVMDMDNKKKFYTERLEEERCRLVDGDIEVPPKVIRHYNRCGVKGLFLLAVVHRRETGTHFKKGKYMVICPFLAIGSLLNSIYIGLRLLDNKIIYFKGALTLFEKNDRIYVPVEFQKITNIDSYKANCEQKNIVIRNKNFDLSAVSKHQVLGDWLEIWNKKYLEK